MFADLTFRELLDRFASPDPTPGGGSAAATAGALGASLLAMVAGMSKTKTGAPAERTALDAARADLVRQRDRLIDLIDRDARAYDLVVAAYRRPKGTDEEKAARKTAIQDAMQVATETPLETMKVCSETMTLAVPVGEHGNPSAKTDIGVGLQLLSVGLQGGAYNVAINLDGLADQALARSIAESTLAIMRTIHESMSRTAAPAGLGDIWTTLARHAGVQVPDPGQGAAVHAAEALRYIGTPEAKAALESLAGSADETVAASARGALARFGVTS